MLYSYILLVATNVVLAAPAPQQSSNIVLRRRDDEHPAPKEFKLPNDAAYIMTDIDAPGVRPTKRSPDDIELSNGGVFSITDVPAKEKRSPEEIKLPNGDHDEYSYLPMWGYNSTITEFCYRASSDRFGNPIIVELGLAASSAVYWQFDWPNTADDQRGNRAGLRGGVPGHIEFEVHNKRSNHNAYTIEFDSCYEYLAHMGQTTRIQRAAPGS
ncbi:hypothetical protein BDV96DRAFT_593043 [Lophiotrema nucula]|uniref:Uncharacterized protein n=1 Tax=Lophiotrema nucula TaxID=690887 RepID=A0A6A5ZS61_9PLEO|nr:hypothetical protein BDV96DRAFT_593043 [Lophiotrema nucula]